jgi:YD repeat-containing protein
MLEFCTLATTASTCAVNKVIGATLLRRLEQHMKVNYDPRTDTLTVIFRDAAVAESDEGKPGMILDYDAAGNIISIEVLDASSRVEEPGVVTVQTAS